MQNLKYFYCRKDMRLLACKAITYLSVNIFLRISLSYLQLLILFLITKWSEKDVMLQIESPEMDKKQRPLSIQGCAKLFLSSCC